MPCYTAGHNSMMLHRRDSGLGESKSRAWMVSWVCNTVYEDHDGFVECLCSKRRSNEVDKIADELKAQDALLIGSTAPELEHDDYVEALRRYLQVFHDLDMP